MTSPRVPRQRSVSSGTWSALDPAARATSHSSMVVRGAIAETREGPMREEGRLVALGALLRRHVVERGAERIAGVLRRAAGVELGGVAEQALLSELRELVHELTTELHPVLIEHARESYLAGSELEQVAQQALELSERIRERLELALREQGLPVPTDPRPSEPPP